jgi:heme-degrading monooxygenase HmoA
VFVVLFEVQPHQERWERYLSLARLLRPDLEAIDGFLDNTRFASARTPGRLLSLSTWRDEKSLIRWRTQATHHEQGQRRGRSEILADYRLRVCEVAADTHPPAGLPVQQDRFDETEVGIGTAAMVMEPLSADRGALLPSVTAAPGLLDVERFDGVLDPHPPLILVSLRDLGAAEDCTPPSAQVRVRRLRVIREYGMHDRREAPQYLPAVPPRSAP